MPSLLIAQDNEPDRPTAYTDNFDFRWIETGDTFQLTAVSKSFAPIELIVSDRRTDKELESILLESMDSVEVITCPAPTLDSAVNIAKEKFRISYFLGHPELIAPDTEYLYRLPFEEGRKVKVTQGWNGRTSHNNVISKYAYDFELEVGDPVFAAREGIVIKTVDWFTKQGGPELRHSANRILIMHEDGTIATYVHLEFKGVEVSEGQYVEKGQRIGTSGLTGYTNGPHLHFVLRKERDISIPMYFEGYNGMQLKEGKKYRVK